MTAERAGPQVSNLESLARAHFLDPPLTAAEIKLLHEAVRGFVAVCGPSSDHRHPANQPSTSEGWGRERQIRADLIRWLCVDREAKELVDPNGIQALGAKINEPLDLAYVSIPFPLVLWNCRLVGDARLRDVEISELHLKGSWVDSIRADEAKVKGSLFLSDGFRAHGEVRLIDAQIGGDLDCRNGTLDNPPREEVPTSGKALSADGAVIKGRVFLGSGFLANGEVRFLGARIEGNLDCEGGTFNNHPWEAKQNARFGASTVSGRALMADDAVVKGSVILQSGFSAYGEVRLVGAEIGRSLVCNKGTFKNPFQRDAAGSGNALNAERITVTGEVFFGDGFHAQGQVLLLGARILGSLGCSGAVFDNRPQEGLGDIRPALDVSHARIDGNLVFSAASRIDGEMRLLGAQIGGDFDCGSTTFSNPFKPGAPGSGTALRADTIVVKGNMNLRNGFRADGEVRLVGAHVQGDLD